MQKRTLLLCVSCLVVALLTGCPSPPPDGPPQPKDDTKSTFDPSKATATVSGKISFDGMPPANDKIQMSSDPYCQMHAADYATAETVRVSDGGLENVIVYVSSGLPTGISYPAAANAVDIVQQNCHYIPHVFTIMTNQTLNVKNGDMTLHNIHVWAEKNPQFNTGQPLKDMVSPAKFALSEVPVPIRCDVHRWMAAFAGVFDHPFETVSKPGGVFELPKLPPGTYEITAWHERFGKKAVTVTIGDNDKKDVNFSFNGNDKAAD
jgi:hypothetical protein